MDQNVLLDTSILQYTLKKTWKNPTKHLLSILEEDGFEITISEISVFECLRTITPSAKEETIKTLEGLKRYQVSEDVLKLSADLYGYYRYDKKIRKTAEGISTEDIIIGATAILTDSFILTTDYNDFPRPFFKENSVWRAEDKKGKTKSLYFYLLSVNKKILEDTARQLLLN